MFHMWDPSMGGGWWWMLGGIWMLTFWGGIIALIVWGIKRLTEHGSGSQKDNPLEMAKARYARGEIARETFEQLKKDL